MLPLLLFVLGLPIGSFLNVVINRTQRKKSFILGRSHCEACEYTLQAIDLIPVASFLLLKGKCRSCKQPISWQYPLVELTTGLAFFFIGLKFVYQIGLPDQIVFDQLIVLLVRDLTVTVFLILLFVYDWKERLILDRFSAPAIIIAFAANVFVGNVSIGSMVLGAAVVGGFFAVQFFLSNGKWIGGGDIRMGLLMGVLLGFVQGLAALFLAYIVGAVVGIILLARKRVRWRSSLPFGTFLAVSTYLMILIGQPLIDWYIGLLM